VVVVVVVVLVVVVVVVLGYRIGVQCQRSLKSNSNMKI
jgi:Tfp pilus assembly protein PilO